MKKEQLLIMMEKLSPDVKNTIERRYLDVVFLHASTTGVFIRLDDKSELSYYCVMGSKEDEDNMVACIEEESKNWQLTDKTITVSLSYEQTNVVSFLDQFGFQLLFSGVVMQYGGKTIEEDKSNLTISKYQEEAFDLYVELFESAYYAQSIDNQQDPTRYSSNHEAFRKLLQSFDNRDELRFFFKDNQLLGAYILDEHYIRDMVIAPRYQNQGYGQLLLFHSIKHLNQKYPKSSIYLKVRTSNLGAKRFYERNGFSVVGSYIKMRLQFTVES